MGTATQPVTFSELYTSLMNRVRADTGQASKVTIAKRYIDTGLQDMHIGFTEKFPWAERREILVTQPEYTTGTLAVTKGGTALTGTSTAWNTNNDFGVANMRVGGKIVIAGTTEVYRIASVSSDTAATISSAWIDATETEATYVYFEDEYALHADFLRPLDLQSFDENTEIDLISRSDFRRRYPRSKTTQRPRVATIIDDEFASSTTPVRKVRFWRPPDQAYMIPYQFITNKLVVSSAGVSQTSFSADADEPIVPLRYRHAIVLHALKNWYRDLKDDQRWQAANSEYTDLMLRISGDQEVGSNRPQIQPRVTSYVRSAKRPYSMGGRRGRRYDTGGAFDRLE